MSEENNNTQNNINNKIDLNNFVFLNTKQVAEMLGCSVYLVREIMHREDFPLIKVGSKFKVYAPALDEWARGHRV